MTEEAGRLKLIIKTCLVLMILFAVWLVFVIYNQNLIEERQKYIAVLTINIICFVYCALSGFQTVAKARRRIKELSAHNPGQVTQQ